MCIRDSIYCSLETVDVYNPKVVQSTMGSITRVDVIYTDIRKMIQEVDVNVKVYGAVMDGDDINQIKVNKNSLIVFYCFCFIRFFFIFI